MKSAVMSVQTNENVEARSVSDYAALAIATCGGVGYMPIVPATWGSLIGIAAFLSVRKFAAKLAAGSGFYYSSETAAESAYTMLLLVSLIILFLVGTRTATRVVRLTGEKDPRCVVIDEVVGQLIFFLFIPFQADWWLIASGFVAFRVFDIWKPYPANVFESLPTGLGVMSDDVVAGFYAATFVSVIYWLSVTIF